MNKAYSIKRLLRLLEKKEINCIKQIETIGKMKELLERELRKYS